MRRFAMVCDFLQSNDMVAKILAMMSEDIGVKAILQELLQPHGAQLEVRFPTFHSTAVDLIVRGMKR